MMNRKRHSAGVTMEVAIGVALAVAVLFVILGLFNNNLKNMIVNTNLSNIFKNNDVKTAFTAFNKDYSNSQINVQIMGEQGLTRLRKKANNLALTLIESPFNNTNVNANTIEYLSLAIEAIVGQGDICVYMKNDSDKFCNEDGIGGYAYLINPSDPSVLTMKKVDSSGASVAAAVDLPLNTTLGSAISSSAVSKDSSGRSTLSKNEKYAFIKSMTNNFQSHITSGASLVRMLNNFVSTTGSSGGGGGIGTFVTAVPAIVTNGSTPLTTEQVTAAAAQAQAKADTDAAAAAQALAQADADAAAAALAQAKADTDAAALAQAQSDAAAAAAALAQAQSDAAAAAQAQADADRAAAQAQADAAALQGLTTDSITLLGDIKNITQYAFDNYGGAPSIDPGDNRRIKAWADGLTATINNATTKQAIASAIFSSFNTSSDVYDDGIFRLAYDREPGRETACEKLVKELINIAQKYNLSNSDFGISEITLPSFSGTSTTYYTVPSGKYICGVQK